MEDLTLIQKMADIQSALKVPKDKTAKVKMKTGGEYTYTFRNAEQILKKVKPLLKEHDLIITMEDQIIFLGTKYFISSKAMVTDGENAVTATGVSEILDAAQMNDSQASGATSSYARKYALAGLFGLSEADDADSPKYGGYREPAEPKLLSDKQQVFIEDLLEVANKEVALKWYKEQFGSKPIGQLTSSEAKRFISYLKGE